MMKKMTVIFCGAFMFASLAGAGEGFHGKDKEAHFKAKKERMESLKKDKTEYFNKLEKLTDRYNKTSGSEKIAIKAEIKRLVSKETDRNIALKKEKFIQLGKKISEMEANKESIVNQKVNMFTSPEGKKKIKNMREKMNNKKDLKKGKHKDKKEKFSKKNK